MNKPYYINQSEISELTEYLRAQSWLLPGEQIHELGKAGEGNMNLVLRIQTDKRSFILKQARPWVEKYPQIEAPQERSHVEAAYYHLTQHNPVLRAFSPQLFKQDKQNNILLLEDFGSAKQVYYDDATSPSTNEIKILIGYLDELHNSINTTTTKRTIENAEMRKLNHYHIFVFPFESENNFSLDDIQSGLHEVALNYKINHRLKEVAARLGAIYLANGDTLLHGDFYPGSWMRTALGIKVIDPEFCFFGAREYDLGILTAHLILLGFSQNEIQRNISNCYTGNIQENLLRGFAGMEIIRRLIGVAQLPLKLNLNEKSVLLENSCNMLLGSNQAAAF